MGEALKEIALSSKIESEQKWRGTALTELIMEINFSKSDSEIEDYIIDLLKNTNKSIKEIENQIQDDPSNLELQGLRTKIITEWKELIKNVRSSLKSNRDFTEQELAIIKLDQSNIIKLSDQNSTSTEILNSAGNIARSLGFSSDDLDIDATKATNQYQDDLVIKILGETAGQGFGNNYLKGYDESKGGNFVLKISDLEDEIKKTNGQNLQTLNPELLRSYINYLKNELVQKEDKTTYFSQKNFSSESIQAIQECLYNLQHIKNAKNISLNELATTPQNIPYVVEYLNTRFRNYEGGDELSFIDSAFIRTKTLSEIKTKVEAKSYQKELIYSLMGDTASQGFGKGYITCNNREHGLYLLKTSDIETRLKNQDVNLVNETGVKGYISYLQSTNSLNFSFLSSNFGREKARSILKTAEELSRKNMNDGVSWTDTIYNACSTVKNVFNQIGDFFTSFKNVKNVNETRTLIRSQIDSIKDPAEKQAFFDGLKQEFINDKDFQKSIKEMFLQELNKNPSLDSITKGMRVEKLMGEILGCLKNISPNSIGEFDKILENFEKENGISIKIAEKRNYVLQELEKVSAGKVELTKLDIETLNNKITELEKSISLTQEQKDELETLKQQLKEFTVKLEHEKQKNISTQATLKLAETITEEETREALKQENPQEAYKEISERKRKENKELDNYLKQYEQQKAEYEKKYPAVEQKQQEGKNIQASPVENNTNILPTNTLTYNHTQINYIPSSNGNVTLDTGNKKIDITQDEFKIVENNQEALKNLINFKETLDELHIEKLWDFRDDIFNILRDEYPILFNENDTFLSEHEVIIFLNSVLASVDLKAYNSPHMDSLKSNFWIKNNISVLGGTNSENQVNGNTSIEQTFMNKFCPIMNNGRFESAKFRESIGNKK